MQAVVFEDDVDTDTLVATPATKRGRTINSWTLYWGQEVIELDMTKVYDFPIDLYNYLKERDCLVATL